MEDRIAAFRKEAEIIEKRFEKLFNSRPGFLPEKPDSIHNHYVLTPVPMQQLEEAYHKIFGK